MESAISNKRDLVKLLNFWLAPMGFVHVKDDWYLDNSECVSIVGLGKSLYGGQFSLAVAFLLKELVPSLLPYPPFHLCNFKKSAEFIVPNRNELKAALNLENNLSSKSRNDIIVSDLTKFVIPFIITLNSKQVIANEFRVNQDFEVYCDLDLKLVLERNGYLDWKELKLDY